jgi:hypothetical protein
VPEPADIERDLRRLDTELRKLEAEYNMYFAGRLPRPPVESRARVAQLVKRLDREHIQSYADRFRFGTLQARFNAFVELWERGARAREEGRPGPGGRPVREAPGASEPAADSSASKVDPGSDRVSLNDPAREMDKVQALYERLTEARRAAGEEAVPFHRFTALVTEQVRRLREKGNTAVAFRIAVKDGKVSLTAKGERGEP